MTVLNGGYGLKNNIFTRFILKTIINMKIGGIYNKYMSWCSLRDLRFLVVDERSVDGIMESIKYDKVKIGFFLYLVKLRYAGGTRKAESTGRYCLMNSRKINLIRFFRSRRKSRRWQVLNGSPVRLRSTVIPVNSR